MCRAFESHQAYQNIYPRQTALLAGWGDFFFSIIKRKTLHFSHLFASLDVSMGVKFAS